MRSADDWIRQELLKSVPCISPKKPQFSEYALCSQYMLEFRHYVKKIEKPNEPPCCLGKQFLWLRKDVKKHCCRKIRENWQGTRCGLEKPIFSTENIWKTLKMVGKNFRKKTFFQKKVAKCQKSRKRDSLGSYNVFSENKTWETQKSPVCETNCS